MGIMQQIPHKCKAKKMPLTKEKAVQTKFTGDPKMMKIICMGKRIYFVEWDLFKKFKCLMELATLANQLEHISLPFLRYEILSKVIDWIRYYKLLFNDDNDNDDPRSSDNGFDKGEVYRPGEWEVEFFKMDRESLLELTIAAHFFGFTPLRKAARNAAALRGLGLIKA